VTVLVGENGSGKSTLVEALALAFGLSPEGGSRGAQHSSRSSESDLHKSVQLLRGVGASRWGFFLRAETMHGFYTYLEHNPPTGTQPEAKFHEMSHGESFLEILSTRFESPGLYVLDEPESALSFTGCLALVGRLNRLVAGGRAQVVVATHSPIVAALPGATILEVGDWGLRTSAWSDLVLVDHWRRFLEAPNAYLRHVLEP
jgi:predicted ATPase